MPEKADAYFVLSAKTKRSGFKKRPNETFTIRRRSLLVFDRGCKTANLNEGTVER